ncbi:hypothetical protein I3842_09G140900 [Carya illinoinensis]|uniref:Uncharacterized protein n=1 Tax=Carya illinoinensis TaxID=32201 RepID=A0A922E6W5_CARIL|nr:hypothetical protein I3842_09G140900 [Carya illinoinensis]
MGCPTNCINQLFHPKKISSYYPHLARRHLQTPKQNHRQHSRKSTQSRNPQHNPQQNLPLSYPISPKYLLRRPLKQVWSILHNGNSTNFLLRACQQTVVSFPANR